MSNFFFNCTTNIVGGGAKNSAIFIKSAAESSSLSWHFALSPEVKCLLDEWGVVLTNYTIFDVSPARSLSARRKLLKLANSCKPDVVFTMAGPSYVKFPFPHVQGISNPHITHPLLSDLKAVTPSYQIPLYLLKCAYQRRKSIEADYFIFQTRSAMDAFCDRTGVDKANARVIPNAVDVTAFMGKVSSKDERYRGGMRILCPAAPYPHKSLKFIPEYARCMVDLGVENFSFVLTIPKEHTIFNLIMTKAESFGVEKYIETIGSYSYCSVSEVYSDADVVFVPSLLETYSATYLEAFAAKRPLVVADRRFASDVCGAAALYIEPLDATDVAKKLISLFDDGLVKRLIQSGEQVLDTCETQESRIRSILDFLMNISEKERNA